MVTGMVTLPKDFEKDENKLTNVNECLRGFFHPNGLGINATTAKILGLF